MIKRYLYLAGPMTGLSERDAGFWRSSASTFVKMVRADGWEILDPTREEEPESGGIYVPRPQDHEAHVMRDLEDINTASAVVMNLDQDLGCVSIGTIAELGYAFGIDTPVIVVRENNHIYDHMFVDCMAYEHVTSLRQAVDALRRLRGGIDPPDDAVWTGRAPVPFVQR